MSDSVHSNLPVWFAGAHVILACRSTEKGKEAERELMTEGGTVEFRQLDLSSLASVRKFAEQVKKEGLKIHYLINNAGKNLGKFINGFYIFSSFK